MNATDMGDMMLDMVTLPDGSPVPPGIPEQKVAYILSHLNEVYGPIVFG